VDVPPAGHSCNRFTKDEQKKSEIPASQGPTSQDFYHKMHYYERYGSHKDSLEKETLLQQNLQTWSLFLPTNQTDRANGEEIGILTGFEKLLLAQKVLTFTYPFAFYMFGNELADNDLKNKEIRQDLFEDQQKQLECCVEKLAMNLEGNLTTRKIGFRNGYLEPVFKKHVLKDESGVFIYFIKIIRTGFV
jgi:ariadne-1